MHSLDASTIVFAVVAIIVVIKLRSVLGTRTGNERRPMEPRGPGAPGNVVPFGGPARTAAAPPPLLTDRWKGYADIGSPVAGGLDAIAAAEPGFDAGAFLQGARGAYEMIVNAFAQGDVNALRRLLAPEVMANFAKAIEARRAAQQTMTTTIVSIDGVSLVDARVTNGIASIAVKFAAKLASATLDGSGKLVDGASDQVADHLDIWTFTRTLGARDPNWLLSATETVH